MRKLFLISVIVFFVVPFVPAQAQEPLTAREVITLMGTPQEGGIPNSYLTDPRYRADELEVERVFNSLLELDFAVIGEVRPSSRGFFDQQVSVVGETGALPVYMDNGMVYMDVSVIAAIARYSTDETPVLIPSEIVWSLGYKEIRDLRYHALIHSGFFGRTELVMPEVARVTAYVWVQVRDTHDQRELTDESTWHLLPLVEDEDWSYVILPSWHLVPIYLFCVGGAGGMVYSSGAFLDGALMCGEQTPQEFWLLGDREQRYAPGIYYY